MPLASTAEERILPFPLTHVSVPNPAFTPWQLAGGTPALSPSLDVYHHLVDNPKGVVYLLHGGGGSAEKWVVNEEEAALVADLVRNRYSVVAIESAHRPVETGWFFPDPERYDPATFIANGKPAWNATVNANELLLRVVHTLLGFDLAMRIYLVGFSGGAKFASAMAYNLRFDPPAIDDYYYAAARTSTAGGLNVCAAALHNNTCVRYYFGNEQSVIVAGLVAKARQYMTPSIFIYSENDPNNEIADVEANANFLETLPVPVPTEKCLGRAVKPRADRFARVLGLSFAESRELYAALVPAHVDSNGYLTNDAEGAAAVVTLPAGKRNAVEMQLDVLRARHQVSSEFHHRTVAFFDRHVGELR